MSEPQTKSELPKKGASTRLAAISTPSRTAPETKTATMTGTPSKRPHLTGPRLGARSATASAPLPVSGSGATGSLVPSFWATDELLEERFELRLPREPMNENRVDAGPLQREHLLTRLDPGLGDDQLAGGHVRQQVERPLQVLLVVVEPRFRDENDLGVDALERLLELVLLANLDGAVEPEVERARIELFELALALRGA